jgi:aquaporin Z
VIQETGDILDALFGITAQLGGGVAQPGRKVRAHAQRELESRIATGEGRGAMKDRQDVEERRAASPLHSLAEVLGIPTQSLRGRQDFDKEGRYILRRLFAELFGTFLLVFVAAGAGVANARFGGHAIPVSAQVIAPGLMVASIILFMGAVSGAHLNPVVSIAFALRHDFAWKRVPGYIAAQLAGAVLAMELLVLLLGKQQAAGLTLPGPGVSPALAMGWEAVLTLGLVSVVLGTASGAQNVGWGAAIGVGGYVALAGLVGSPVSGASMNPARSLGPALILGNHTAWWAYVAGPLIGTAIAVGFAWVLRGRGGGVIGRRAGSGTLGELWHPGPIGVVAGEEAREDERPAGPRSGAPADR